MFTGLLNLLGRCYSRDVYSFLAQFYLYFRILSFIVLRLWLGGGWNFLRRPLRKSRFFFLFDIPLFDGSISSKVFFDRSEIAFWITNLLNVALAIYVFLPVFVGIAKVVLRAVP